MAKSFGFQLLFNVFEIIQFTLVLIVFLKVLFRIHHSLGDGIALLRLFSETIADREPPSKDLWAYCSRERQQLKQFLDFDIHPDIIQSKISVWKFIKTLLNCKPKRQWHRFETFIHRWLQAVVIIVTLPASIVRQSLLRRIDVNALHKPKLNGEKVSCIPLVNPVQCKTTDFNKRHENYTKIVLRFQIVCWRFENHDDFNLIDTMKSIKRNHEGLRFSDVLLSALSSSFQRYFESKGDSIPETMTVVVPARIEAESEPNQSWRSIGNW